MLSFLIFQKKQRYTRYYKKYLTMHNKVILSHGSGNAPDELVITLFNQ